MSARTAYPPVLTFRLPQSNVGLGLKDLTAAVFTGLKVHVMRTATFAAVLVLDIGWSLKCIGRPALSALHRRRLLSRYCHRQSPWLGRAPGAAEGICQILQTTFPAELQVLRVYLA